MGPRKVAVTGRPPPTIALVTGRFRILALVALALAAAADEPVPGTKKTDPLEHALRQMGLTTNDLGTRPKATWGRYPHPSKIPHVMPFFSELLANPLDTYEFARTWGNGIEDLLTPAKLTGTGETLAKLGVLLATDRRIGGFRGYSVNLDPRPTAKEPLLHALVTLRERSGDPLRRSRSFGNKYGEDEETPRAKLREELNDIPNELRAPLAKYVLNLIDAREWIERGLRRVPLAMRTKLFASLATLPASTPDGEKYFPIVDDIAALVDEHSLWYGCLKALQATQDARRALASTMPLAKKKAFDFRMGTPWGAVRFTSKDATDLHDDAGTMLLVAFGTAGVWWGPIGATTPKRSLSIALLMEHEGNVGQSVALDVQKDGKEANAACGVLGCGLIYASGEHNNEYRTGTFGLGAGFFGLGALIDEGGSDSYKMAAVGQGAAYFGAGLLLDAAGNDEYTLLEGDGQGFGGPGGIGVLADRSGHDKYYAEPDAKIAGRKDYHSDNKIAASHAQGVGSGRRGDGSDGHAWAGGLGALIDVEGNDEYQAGNFSMGLGYWYGTGLLWDGGGDDSFRSVYFTQGSGAHFAVGALIDEGGNDRHVVTETAGAAFGFGWDVVNAMFLDRGHGNDHYEADRISIGVAEIRSNAFFIDEGGDDVYIIGARQKGFGDVDHRDNYTKPTRTGASMFHLTQVGVFLDLGGNDKYQRRDLKTRTLSPDANARDGATWHLRTRDPKHPHGPNVSIGVDTEYTPSLRFLRTWPARK